mmetsp:Transcript_17181/g.25852  ORF Transcript_17181/g.25852 Transcript_17181/m.25852 type:complete len:88 (+) Transcript_17181:150-413(+)|eukprot:CAMPEP_0184384128 /NCGR_PEP_ID=MMETSP0007-20130409/7674_1 /TAXON_ID=97485 /ORGANISM="Prymnesium parvum, Strain Texoma1" /LENGTH=87 /DNA_ID=CAMNT_0026730881 /DNA_START=71 /DNA_END=334 /DNA_ORIENTATION=-
MGCELMKCNLELVNVLVFIIKLQIHHVLTFSSGRVIKRGTKLALHKANDLLVVLAAVNVPHSQACWPPTLNARRAREQLQQHSCDRR